MRKSVVLLFTCLLVLSIVYTPFSTLALEYGNGSGLGSVDGSYIGEEDNGRMGYAVDIIGDFNGDGYDDMLIGAYGVDGAQVNMGKTYLILGKATGWTTDVDIGLAVASFMGEGQDDRAGISIAGVGDVNGDGYDDFVIGANNNDDGGNGAGQVYLFFGNSTPQTTDLSVSNAAASFWGEDVNDFAGHAVAGVGDVNGDGFADFLIGAYGDDDGGGGAGQAYLILGKASGWAMDTDLSSVDASFIGEAAGDSAGRTLSGAGDVNADGYDDLLIGAMFNSEAGSETGQTYLIFGKAGGWTMDTDLSTADASFSGEENADHSGYSVSTAGDVDGDGFDDFLIGANLYDDSGSNTNEGKAYLILGNDTGWAKDTDLSNADASFVGEVISDTAGSLVAGAGDVNGDGFDDFLIGAENNDDGAIDAGKTYLILGKASGWSTGTSLADSDASFLGEAAGDKSGRSASVRGDVDGDGYDDMFVGSYMNNGGGTARGKVYVIKPDINSRPATISSVKAYSNDTYSVEITEAFVNDTIYIQLNGVDGNSSRRDMANVNVSSNGTSPMGFRMTLLETGVNTGIYRGKFRISERTRDEHRWIGARAGELVTVRSIEDNIYSVSIGVIDRIMIHPLTDNLTAVEDQEYMVQYSAVSNASESWEYQSNCTWATWNATSHGLSGTPLNNHVGSCLVQIRVTNNLGGSALREFNITVNNTPPDILTEDVVYVLQDKAYIVDYNSSDDDQGVNVTWRLETDTGDWLDLDEHSGLLAGTPYNEHVGSYFVNVTVDDGNGGMDYTNFTLTVDDVNEAPYITTIDNYTATEDLLYSMHYIAGDPDLIHGDVLTWSMESNATAWLGLNTTTGWLNGTPRNEHVGRYWVNISVTDSHGLSANTSFFIDVQNSNDLPVITSTPIPKATASLWYYYTVTAEDEDVGDVLQFHLDTFPEGMVVDTLSGLIKWIPSEDQGGMHRVVVRVSDGFADVFQEYNITVTVLDTIPPRTVLNTPLNGEEVTVTTPVLSWIVLDEDSDVVYYDVYLSNVTNKISLLDPTALVIEDTTDVSYVPETELVKGEQYFWTVIPFDGENVGDCVSGIWSFTVTQSAIKRNAPVITSTPVLDAVVGEQYIYKVTATDADAGDTLTYSLDQRPDGMIVDANTGLIIWTPTEAHVGNQVVKVKVSDGSLFDLQIFIVNVTRIPKTNHAPEITPISQRTAKVGEKFEYQVAATDADDNNLTYSLRGGPTGMTISDTGLIVWKPTKDQMGMNTVTVVVSDGYVESETTFDIDVEKGDVGPGDSGLGTTMLLILLLVIIVIVVVAVLAVKMKGGKAPDKGAVVDDEPEAVIDDVFLVYNDGRLISHLTRRLKPNTDPELLTGMFTAIREFLKSQFTTEDGDMGVLREMKYGDNTVLIESGEYVYLAAVIIGEMPEDLQPRLGSTVERIEQQYRDILEEWDGRTKVLKGAVNLMKTMIFEEEAEEGVLPEELKEEPKKEDDLEDIMRKLKD